MKLRNQKILFLALVVYGLYGCSHTPVITEPLINSQAVSEKKMDLKFIFKDDRDEKFKSERSFVFERKFPAAIFSFGDLLYDVPLNTVFENMFIRRFGTSQNGYKAELKLKAFYPTHKPHDLTFVPFVGLLTIGADVEMHGILKTEIAVLDNNDKYIFHKLYDVDVEEMKSSGDIIREAIFDMLIKAFNKFAEEFEIDINRVNFNTSLSKVDAINTD